MPHSAPGAPQDDGVQTGSVQRWSEQVDPEAQLPQSMVRPQPSGMVPHCAPLCGYVSASQGTGWGGITLSPRHRGDI